MFYVNCALYFVGNVLQEGDHIPWHKPLDEAEDSRSLIQHLLVTKDPQLPEITTPYGYLDFRQVRNYDTGCNILYFSNQFFFLKSFI